ncbi:hypothetical protein Q3G72_028592 [Acer saccharum]|nr:hypothetical protein Q3G72_028592 [Acer saccharum]
MANNPHPGSDGATPGNDDDDDSVAKMKAAQEALEFKEKVLRCFSMNHRKLENLMVADIPTDHPSCSKQHAVIQFRQVEKEKPDGTLSKQVRPYLMDLGSTNLTYLNILLNHKDIMNFLKKTPLNLVIVAESTYCYTRIQLGDWHQKANPASSSLALSPYFLK